LESDVGREYTKSIHTPEISRVRESLLDGGDVEEHNYDDTWTLRVASDQK